MRISNKYHKVVRAQLRRSVVFCLAALAIFIGSAPGALASALTLAWDKNPEPNITEYYLDYGLSSCGGSATCAYPKRVPVAHNAACPGDPSSICYTFPDGTLEEGRIHYFAVKARNGYGVSGYSNELEYRPGTSTSNQSPSAANGTLAVTEDTPAGDFLSASDPDGNTLSFSIAAPPVKGTISSLDTATGQFTYSPMPNANGADSFQFRVSDGVLSSTATVSVSISAVNDPPVAAPDTAATYANQPVTISVLGNDTDVDGNPLSLASAASGRHGTTVPSGTVLRYTPSGGYIGKDSFSYTLSDGRGGKDEGLVSVTIHGDTSRGSTPGNPVIMAINAGGGPYTAADGTEYRGDVYYSGGSVHSEAASVADTADDILYQSERYGSFAYHIPVENGTYLLTLKFAEIYWDTANRRVFSVLAEGLTIAGNVDICATVGAFRRYDITVPVTIIDGRLDISFTSLVNHSKLSAILLEKPSEGILAAFNAGGESYTATDGLTYAKDFGFTSSKTYQTAADIAATEDDFLYQSERFGNFSYALPVANGLYQVTLKFAEIYWDESGRRVFDVLIEGHKVISELDLYARVGKDCAYDFVEMVNVVDGSLNIDFETIRDNAKVSAILVQPIY